jgi:Fe-coproporphyrin III synthase
MPLDSELNEIDPIEAYRAWVGADGGLRLPEAQRRRWGLSPGARLRVEETADGLLLRPADPPLRKVYVEPTTACNLNCPICVRHSWREPGGAMTMATYRRLVEGLRDIPTLQAVAFWGLGEPLLHPNILEMVAEAGRLGARTELISNGLLLDARMAEGLIQAGLDTLILSVDGDSTPRDGEVRAGVDQEFEEEILYWLAAGNPRPQKRSRWSPEMVLPRMDARPEVLEPLLSLLRHGGTIDPLLGRPEKAYGYCRFVREGAVAVAWDGGVSPCIPLMHSYTCYVLGREKAIQRYTVGHVNDEEIADIYDRDEYRRFRARVVEFDFSPCADCGGCEYAESNEEDCFGNPFPTCGDCLWARGIIQCP